MHARCKSGLRSCGRGTRRYFPTFYELAYTIAGARAFVSRVGKTISFHAKAVHTSSAFSRSALLRHGSGFRRDLICGASNPLFCLLAFCLVFDLFPASFDDGLIVVATFMTDSGFPPLVGGGTA